MIAGETEVLGENLPSATLSHHKSHMPRSGFEPRTAAVGSQRLTALSYGAAEISVSYSIHSRSDSLDAGSARRKAATYTQNNINRINAH
jgi:hypothetical protein